MSFSKVLTRAEQLARDTVQALGCANIHVQERHNVTVPGTIATVEESIQRLNQSIGTARQVTVYAGLTACQYICTFCRYRNVIATAGNVGRIIDNVLREINLRNRIALPPHTTSSVYIGGGTPTLFPDDTINELLGILHTHHSFGPNTEITIETTPDSISRQKIEALSQINRWSMGVQRLDEGWLRSVKRGHTLAEVHKALQLMHDMGVKFNIDLMYGFEGQTPENFARDIEIILSYEPTQITLYRLEDQKRTDDKTIPVTRQSSIDVYMMQAIGRMILSERGYTEGPDGWFTAPGAHKAQVYEDRWTNQIPMIAYGSDAYSFSGLQQFTNHGLLEWEKCLQAERLPINPSSSFVYNAEQAGRRKIAFKLRSVFETDVGEAEVFFRSLETAGLGRIEGKIFKLSEIGLMSVHEIVKALIQPR